MQIVPIDLTKNPEVANLLVDMQPGQRVYACLTIKDKDEKNANLRIEEIVGSKEELPENDESYDDEDDGTIDAAGEGGAEASGSGREQSNGSGAAPIDSAGQSGPVGG